MEGASYKTHEVIKTTENARFEPEDVWKGARLGTSHEEFSQKARAAGCQGPAFKRQLSRLEGGVDDYQEFGGLFVFTQWLLSRRVQGPKVRKTLHQLLNWEYSRLKDRSPEEKDHHFSSLVNRLRELPLSTSSKKKSYVLGDLVPDGYLFKTGRNEQTIRLLRTPPQSLDQMLPQAEIFLLNSGDDATGGTGLKGCTPCKPDPTSSRGGLKYCVFPGFEGWVECQWPPPPPPPHPEPHWEYIVKVGNQWWTTFLGVWHGSGYTRTAKRTPQLTVPWIVPELYVHIMQASSVPLEEDYCFSLICDGECGDSEHAHNDHEATASDTQLSIFFSPWGINSTHAAAGRSALYCDGKWSWS